MTPALAALILSSIIEKSELDHPFRLTDKQAEALTFAYSYLQNAANAEVKFQDD